MTLNMTRKGRSIMNTHQSSKCRGFSGMPALVVVASLAAIVACEARNPTGMRATTSPPPCIMPGCGVTVTPDDSTINGHPNTNGSALFRIRNDYTSTQTITLTCSSTGNVTCVSLDFSSVSLGPGDSTGDAVTYHLGNPGTGNLILHGVGSLAGGDSGYYHFKFLR